MTAIAEPKAWMNEDEFQLADLSSIKLVKRLQGTLSIGVPALVTGGPDPRNFFPEQFRKMNAHCVVLGTISGKIEATESLLKLRQCSHELEKAIDLLQQKVSHFLDVDQPGDECNFEAIRDSAVGVCDKIAEFRGLLALDSSLIAKVKATIVQLVDAMPNFVREEREAIAKRANGTN